MFFIYEWIVELVIKINWKIFVGAANLGTAPKNRFVGAANSGATPTNALQYISQSPREAKKILSQGTILPFRRRQAAEPTAAATVRASSHLCRPMRALATLRLPLTIPAAEP